MRWRLVLIFVALLAIMGIACGGDGNDEAVAWDSPEELLKQSSEYINKKQWDKLFETCAPSYRSNHTPSDLQNSAIVFMRLFDTSKLSAKNIQVVESGNRATATYDLVLDGDTLRSDNEYVRINGVWYDDQC